MPPVLERHHQMGNLAQMFRKFLAKLEEPFRSISLVSVCFGLRISECLGLKWSDVEATSPPVIYQGSWPSQ